MGVQLLDGDESLDVKDSELEGVDSGDPETVYVARRLTSEVIRRVRKLHTNTKRNRRNGSMETDTDDEAVQDDLLDYALTDWRGPTLKGQPAPCTRFNKINGLDAVRKAALLIAAGVNRLTSAPEEREASFR